MPSSVFGELVQPTRVKIIFSKYIIWNRDCKKEKKKDPACCYQMLTKLKKQGSNKPARFTILEVLRHVKAQHSQLLHMN